MTVRAAGREAAITRYSAPLLTPTLSRGIARLASTEANTSKPKATLAAAPVPVSVTQEARSRGHSVLISRPPPATAPLGRVGAGPTEQRRRPARPRGGGPGPRPGRGGLSPGPPGGAPSDPRAEGAGGTA